MELISTLVDFLTIPLALYGGYTLLGLPGTDSVTALGRKFGQWIMGKFSNKA